MLGLIAVAALSFAGWRWGADSRVHGESVNRDW